MAEDGIGGLSEHSRSKSRNQLQGPLTHLSTHIDTHARCTGHTDSSISSKEYLITPWDIS